MLASREGNKGWRNKTSSLLITLLDLVPCSDAFFKKIINSLNTAETNYSVCALLVCGPDLQNKVHTLLPPSTQSLLAVWLWPAFFAILSTYMPCIHFNILCLFLLWGLCYAAPFPHLSFKLLVKYHWWIVPCARCPLQYPGSGSKAWKFRASTQEANSWGLNSDSANYTTI